MWNYLHEEALKLLTKHETSYAKPMNSQEIGEILKVTPSYIRSQLSQLVKMRRVGVRKGNGGGYYVIQKERRRIQMINNSEKQFEELGILLAEMENYLHRVELGCQDLSVMFHTIDKSQSLENLTQIMEGVDYYQKLLKSAAVFLSIDFSEILCKEMSISSLFNHLLHVFTSIFEAAENEDYSLLTDIVEYDLVPAINISQGLLEVVQGRYEESVM